MHSNSEFDRESFEFHLSEEERNGLVELRHLSWTGKVLKPGERWGVIWNNTGPTKKGFRPPTLTEDAKQVIGRSYEVLKKHFEKRSLTVETITFVQERAPDGTAESLARVNEFNKALKDPSYPHVDGQGYTQYAILVLDEDGGGTEFLEGSIAIWNVASIRREEIAEALNTNSADMKFLNAGRLGFFNGDTIHNRGKFVSELPRVAIIVQFV
ncbi:MAG: hypothetical protein AAB383_06490 [Patescibacteria group bacterium]